MDPITLIIGFAALLLGGGVGFFLSRNIINGGAEKIKKDAQEKANSIVEEAERNAEALKKDKMLESKEKFLKMKTDLENEINKKRQQLQQNEEKVKKKDQNLNKQQEKLNRREAEIESKEQDVQAQLETVKKKNKEIERLRTDQIQNLEKISNLSEEQAKEQLMQTLKDQAQLKATSIQKEIVEDAKAHATKEAKRIVLNTIQRTATEHTIENCVSVFNIENDEVKGKIIGREGRNIRSLESATGVEIIVDDTPEAIIISGFDPVRREIARLSLHRLVSDGRIHPARIEEVVKKTSKNIEEEIVEYGEKAVIDLGIHGLHPDLVKMVGRMRFRSSYGQNLLQHSREVANLCSLMAAEMGLDAKKAKRAGLLHDIGKVWPEEQELPHALLGMELAKKYKENEEVCNAVGAHHDDIEMNSLLSPIVQVCDAISGARPGARREVVDSYIKRLQELENLALSFEGVQNCYAVQAGRELRVIVDAESTSDEVASNMAYQISDKIEAQMQYPGQVKVTVIREMRSVSYAK